jgi:hypothetical protein
MRLFRATALVVLMLAAVSCDSSPLRPLLHTRRSYALVGFDGESLPVTFESGPSAFTILSGTLVLDSTGIATNVTHARATPSNFGPPEFDTSKPGEFRIQGDSIEIGYFTSCPDLCIPNRYGVISDSSVTLVDPVFFGSGAHTFLYKLVDTVQ